MNPKSTEAIILKRINFGEADRILTVLTNDSGQLSMLAKGVRKSKSKLAGGLELFSVSDINYIDGRSDLKTIVSTRIKSHFKNIVSDVDRTFAGYDFMKIIAANSQHIDDNQYYELLKIGLDSLDNTNLPIAIVEVWFYSRLLSINGSGVNVENPLGHSAFSDDQNYNFSYDDMSFVISDNGTFMPTHIKFLRLVNRADSPSKLISILKSSEIAVDLKDITKQAATMHKA
jgi:DNA repair protein RecO (recombination protein O)